MLSKYEKCHKFVSNEIFFLGAPNKTGHTIESMDKKLVAINYFSSDIITAAEASSFLERMAITYIISKVFNLGNCERQSMALFMHILNKGHFKESLEIILINGKSIIGPHRCVVADRNQKSNLNDLSTWQNATYLDTWNNEILSDKHLTSLTKEQFAVKGGVSGNVKLKSIYRRQEKLTLNECIDLIKFLTESKSKLTVSRLKFIKKSYPNDLKELLLNLDERSLVDLIHTQISNDISRYKAMAINVLINKNTLEHTMFIFQEKQNLIFDFKKDDQQINNEIEEARKQIEAMYYDDDNIVFQFGQLLEKNHRHGEALEVYKNILASNSNFDAAKERIEFINNGLGNRFSSKDLEEKVPNSYIQLIPKLSTLNQFKIQEQIGSVMISSGEDLNQYEDPHYPSLFTNQSDNSEKIYSLHEEISSLEDSDDRSFSVD